MTTINHISNFHWRILLVACAMILLHARPGMAQTVTAQLQQKNPNSVVIEIVLKQPASGNMIVELNFPPRLNVQTTTPDAAKIDHNKGVIKWLIRNAKPGKVRLLTVFSQSFGRKDVSAVVRYRTNREGSLVEVQTDWK